MLSFVDILEKRINSDPSLTPAGLANKAGLDNSTIRQMLKARRNPRIDVAMKICHALGETLETFMSGAHDPVMSELLAHLEQLSDAERLLLLNAARGLRDHHPAANE